MDEHTLGWADFRGNLQHISTGNVTSDDRVALIVMDLPGRRRLKVFGRARVVFAEDEPEQVGRLATPGYQAVVERGVLVSVAAYDWNCPQHITPRYTAAELRPVLLDLQRRIDVLEAENAELRAAGRPSG